MKANWQLHLQQDYPQEILELFGSDTLIARLLANRSVLSAKEALYYKGDLDLAETDPLEIPEMDKAFERIERAIAKREKILIYGDYDVDGTSSVALLSRAFQMIGVQTRYYIPNRHSEGYGLNKTAIYRIRDEGAQLLISCDCGISNYEEVKYASELGLDVIVTDHHSLPQIAPPSIANCNPKTLSPDHPLHHLPGVGVAYKLAALLLKHYAGADAEALSYSLLDLVALGMIADMAALRAENRLLVRKGLSVLSRTSKPGLQALLKLAGALQANTEHIGFAMAPRINAAGRLSDANKAVELMLTEDSARAADLASELDRENRSRQELCEQHFEEALDLIAAETNLAEDACIVLAKEGWHHGVIGIVASRILDKFHLPVFIMAIEGSQARGSVRSVDIDDLDIFREMQALQAEKQIFSKFGGHRAAAGFSVEAHKIPELKASLKAHFKARLKGFELAKTYHLDSAVFLGELDFDFLQRIQELAPYGIANPSPLFVAGPLKIRSWRLLGSERKHIKLFLSQESTIGSVKIPVNNKIYTALLWQKAEEFLQFVADSNQEFIALFTIRVSEYQGERSLELELKDWKATRDIDPRLFARFKPQELAII